MISLFAEEKIAKALPEIRQTIWRESCAIPTFKFCEGDPRGAHRPDCDDSQWADFQVGETWGGYDKIAWFRAHVPIPAHLRARKLALRFLVGPRDGGGSTAETLLYVNGQPLQGIDVWHEEAWLPPEHLQGDSILIALRAWSGVLDIPPRRHFRLAQLNWIDEGAEGYYYLAGTLLKAIQCLEPNDWRRTQLLEALDQSFQMVSFIKPRSEEYYASVQAAHAYLKESLATFTSYETHKPKVVAVGHAHIDMAWLWRLSHSRDKAARTFATALHLMRQYPEYRFLHSSPQLYRFLSQDYPEIFEQVKAKIASAQWEITGGMWIEADTNIPNGESLIRQILYGKRYMRETFGVESKVLWLPDVFGYSWALPQILRKSGIRYFMTTKISWSQFNRMPYDTFHWRGIDGTEILTHFITTPEKGSRFYTYNGTLHPYEVRGIWETYRSRNINDELLLAFGWGDGGGGPTQEMLEAARVMQNLPGFPTVEMGTAEPYFERLERRLRDKDVPVWDGELYLEYHRGTYTSQAQVKRANRLAEILYHNAEWANTLADTLTGQDGYPDLREGWEALLLNQFHDILPGSSIREVYEDAAADYARIERIGQAALEGGLRRIAENVRTGESSLIVFNSLSWPRSGLVELPCTPELEGLNIQKIEGGRKALVPVSDVPSLGYRAYALAQQAAEEAPAEMVVETGTLENRFYRIELNERGQMTSIYDKRCGREVLAPNARGNVLQAFEDKPMNFDAWDIDIYYQQKMQEIDALVEAQVEERGPLRGTLRLQWRFYDSTITQRISIYQRSARIDFRTEIDWHEQQVLLKAAFPVDIRATHATYDIQFGSITRPNHWNTSWDYARFEVPAHKWADLSEGNYGVALLNDCKYGCDVRDNVLRLTLLKSAIRPDALADKGHHEFTYSLYPHSGGWAQSDVARAAYELNTPLLAMVRGEQPAGTLPGQHSFASVDAAAPNIIVETVKKAEDGDGWIVRAYEDMNCRSQSAAIRFGQPIRRAVECSLIEEGAQPVDFQGSALTFAMKPYEIRTFRVWF